MPISSASRNCRIWSSPPQPKSWTRCNWRDTAGSVGSEDSLDGQPDGTVADRGHPRFGLPRRLETFDVFGKRSQQSFRLQKREYPAHTGMYSIAEAQVIAVVSAHLEPIRRLPAPRVTVGGCE